MSEDNSMMLVVVLGVAGMCCSSVAALGFAWWNNWLCDCCSLCRTEGTDPGPNTGPAPEPGPIVPSPEGPPADDNTGDDDDGDNNENVDNEKDSSSDKLPSTFFTSSGYLKSKNGFYLTSAHSSCRKSLISILKFAQDTGGVGLVCVTEGAGTGLQFVLGGDGPKKHLLRMAKDLNKTLALISMKHKKTKKVTYILSTRYVSGGQKNLQTLNESGLSAYEMKSSNLWDFRAGPKGTVYLYNVGHQKYLSVSNCGKGQLEFIGGRSNKARWRMTRGAMTPSQLPSKC
jgi:hypothetical protein